MLIYLIGFVVGILVSWGINVGIIYLITLCFGIKITLINATGVWLTLGLIRSIFLTKNNKE